MNTSGLEGRSVERLLSLKKLAEVSKEQYLNGIKQFLVHSGQQPDGLVVKAKRHPRAFEKEFVEFLDRKGKETSAATVALIRNSVKKLLDVNGVSGVDWVYINDCIPEKRRYGEDRAPTAEEIRRMVNAAELRTKCIILFLCSSGARMGAIPALRWGDFQEAEHDGQKLARVTIYRGEPERYETFVTPEAYQHLLEYRRYRENLGEEVTPQSFVFVNALNVDDFRPDRVRGVTTDVVKALLGRLQKQLRIRRVISEGKNARRFEFKQCVTPDTYIIDNPSGILASRIGESPAEEFHPLAHSGRFETTTDKFGRLYRGEIIEICPYFTNIPTRLTPEHPVLCRALRYRFPNSRRNFIGLGEPTWMAAKDIIARQVAVGYPRVKTAREPATLDIKELIKPKKFAESDGKLAPFQGQRNWIPSKVPLTPGLMKVFGFYLAEGSVDRKGSVLFSFGLHEDYDLEVGRLCKEIFDVNPKIHYMKRAKNLAVNSTVLARAFATLFGTGAFEKRIPTWFFSLPPRLLWPMLEGCRRGDGSIDVMFSPRRHTRVRVMATISRNLAEQLRLTMHKLGVPSSLWLYDSRRIKHRIQAKHPIYYVEVPSTFSDLIKDKMGLNLEIPPSSKRKTELRHQAWVDDDYVWIAVRRTARSQYSGQVYNLEVSPSNSYTANGFIVHNCHGFRNFFKTRMELSGVKPIITEMLMGHTVGVANSYMKPTDEELVGEYSKAIDNLTIVGTVGEKADRKTEFKREILLKVGGYSKEEVDRLELASMEDAEIQKMVRERLLGVMTNNGNHQKVIPISEVETYLTKGWEYVAALPTGKAVLRLPN